MGWSHQIRSHSNRCSAILTELREAASWLKLHTTARAHHAASSTALLMNALLVLVLSLLDVWIVPEHSIQRLSQILQFYFALTANVRVQHDIELIFSVKGLEAWELSEEIHCFLHGQRAVL